MAELQKIPKIQSNLKSPDRVKSKLINKAEFIIGPEGPPGPQGPQGNSLEYNWDGTNLGVRVEGQEEYEYQDLLGPQGEQGEKGDNALINGVNVLTIQEGNNIELVQQDDTLIINNTYEYDDTDIKTNIQSLEELTGELDKDLSNAQNDIESLETEKADRTEIPDVSEFIKNTVDNLVNYYKKTETYTQSEVNQLIGAVKSVSMKVVPTRPETGETNIIYLVPSATQTSDNVYDEWIYVDNKWELIGNTVANLINYYTKEEINTLLFDYITSNDLENVLENYVSKTKIATSSTLGLVMANPNEYGIWCYGDGNLAAQTVNYEKYNTMVNATFIGKGTLENVITGKELTNKKYVDDEVEKLDNRINEMELFKFPNAIIHGTPIINNGQVSSFNSENYLSLPAIFDLHDRGFEFNFAFRTNSDVITAQNILGSRFCMALLLESGKIKLRVSSNGTSWDLVDITGDIDVQTNTLYYVQIYFDKLTYKLKYSLDGLTYTEIASKVASVSPHPAQIYLGIGNNFFNPFKGILNLNKCYLKVNNSVVWQGMDDAGLATRMAVDMENIDEAGIEKIDEIVNEKGYVKNDYLDDYVPKTQKATNTVLGLVRTGNMISVNAAGELQVDTMSYTQYSQEAGNKCISKGTLENVIVGKDLANKSYVDEKIGDIDTILTNIDTGEGVE